MREEACIGGATMPQPWTLRLTQVEDENQTRKISVCVCLVNSTIDSFQKLVNPKSTLLLDEQTLFRTLIDEQTLFRMKLMCFLSFFLK